MDEVDGETVGEHLAASQAMKQTAGVELFPTSDDAILPCSPGRSRDLELIVEVSLESGAAGCVLIDITRCASWEWASSVRISVELIVGHSGKEEKEIAKFELKTCTKLG